jgi:hypothetical protein
MSRPPTSVASGSLALAMLLAGATSATASTPPVQVHYADSYDSVLPDPGDPDGSFCGGLTGVPLHTEIDGHVSVVQHGPDGATYFADRFRSTLTYTNPTTNLTFTVVRVRQTKDLRITDNGDGTLTLVGLSTGSLWSYGPDGESFGCSTGGPSTRSSWTPSARPTPSTTCSTCCPRTRPVSTPPTASATTCSPSRHDEPASVSPDVGTALEDAMRATRARRSRSVRVAARGTGGAAWSARHGRAANGV